MPVMVSIFSKQLRYRTLVVEYTPIGLASNLTESIAQQQLPSLLKYTHSNSVSSRDDRFPSIFTMYLIPEGSRITYTKILIQNFMYIDQHTLTIHTLCQSRIV